MTSVTARDYLRTLEPFARAAQDQLYEDPSSGLLCYGSGGSDHWSVQSNLKALAALAVLAADKDFQPARAQVARDQLLDQARDCLRFALHTHHSGEGTCTDGKSWGHSWISALGLERVFHGIEALRPHLEDDDHAAIARLVASEADWLLTSYDVKAGQVEDNKPESNLWNGILLHRAAILAPDHEHAEVWKEEGTRFLLNGISHPDDATSETMVAGKAVKDWHVGANFFPTWGLNHHHYLNVGYMVICLSQVAMMHFWCKARGIPPPAGLDHHAADLWRVVRHFCMDDGRLARIGGDTRVRYNYCQDYVIPMWLWAQDTQQATETVAMERGWLAQIRREMAANSDATFCGDRLAGLAAAGPVYWLRLETDRAASLSMGLWWRRQHGLPGAEVSAEPDAADWACPYHGAALSRGKRRLASWAWRGAEGPLGLCVPTDASDLMEWRENLTIHLRGCGRHHRSEILRHHSRSFTGGFVSGGRIAHRSEGHVAEGMGPTPLGQVDLAAIALPDDATMVVFQRHRTPAARTWLTRFQAVNLMIPNDLWNGHRRIYRWDGGDRECVGLGGTAEHILTHARWITCDNRIGLALIAGEGSLSLSRPGTRQIGLTKRDAWEGWGGFLACDEISVQRHDGLHEIPRSSDHVDLAVAVLVDGNPRSTEALVRGSESLDLGDDLRACLVPGQDGHRYLAVANIGEAEAAFILPRAAARCDLGGGTTASGTASALLAGDVGLWRIA